MTYQDVLVQIDNAAARARYEIAARIAAAGGHVTGLYLKTSLINQYNNIESVAWLPPDELNQVIREHNAAQDKAAEQAGECLANAAAAQKVGCDWRVIGGDAPDDLIAEARCADLTVMPRPLAAPDFSVRASAIDVALGGGPVLIAPDEVESTSVGSRVLLAWNGSREASRALQAAMRLMADGAEVEVRMAHPSDVAPDTTAPLRRHLERHGFRANLVVVSHPDERVADWLKNEATKTGCDLIVMGLYGHTRLQEFVLGGVSRGMLHTSPLPLLIAH